MGGKARRDFAVPAEQARRNDEEEPMRIAISTPTGNVGSALTRRLLGGEHQLVLLARDPGKLAAFTEHGAAVEQGSLGDKRFVARAIRGADTFFLVIPPNFDHEDYRAFQREIGEVTLTAIREAQTPRVVLLSSVGAHLGEGFGPISALGEIERELDKIDVDATYLRPNSFMENFFGSAQGIWSDSAVFLPLPGSVSVGFVAAADIGKVAADIILDTGWSGKRAIELSGPEDITYDEAAAILGKAIGKEVKHVQCTPEQMFAALTAAGFSQSVVELYIELDDAQAKGRLTFETKPLRGETTFADFAQNVFRPGYDAMTG
jgi:uncharacterized protein YbjT (DUF2867 family)